MFDRVERAFSREAATGRVPGSPGLREGIAGEKGPPDLMILLLRGRAYLRMEYTPASMATLQHAAVIFTRACESALNAVPAVAP